MSNTWIFAMGTNRDGEPVWWWTRNGYTVVESQGPCPTFEDCVKQARKYGFDFTQPYHLTTIRPPEH